jgi:hypothetical protein
MANLQYFNLAHNPVVCKTIRSTLDIMNVSGGQLQYLCYNLTTLYVLSIL